MERIFGAEDQGGNYVTPRNRPRNRGISLVRYADDFLVFARNPYEVEWYVRPKLQAFLATRGLALSEAKTRVTTRAAGFNFLGFTVRQVWKKYSKILLVTPQKEKVKNLLARVKGILSTNKQATVENLVRQLNPVIRGWAQYYSHCNAKRTFSYVDYQIFKKLWRWCVRRHQNPHKGKRWVKNRYFLTIGARHWVFGESPTLHLVFAADTPITPHVKVRGYASPFDPALRSYWERRAARKVEERYWSKTKKAVLARQGYRCWRCGRAIQEEDSIHFHHKIRRCDGGSSEASNLRATHQHCHQQLHKHSGHPSPEDLR
jgi:RNA-directed DNA polymerase